METQSKIELLEKLTYLAGSKLPVSEECGVYQVLLHRKETCIRMLNPKSEGEYKLLEKLLEYTENLIKDYFYL